MFSCYHAVAANCVYVIFFVRVCVSVCVLACEIDFLAIFWYNASVSHCVCVRACICMCACVCVCEQLCLRVDVCILVCGYVCI